MKKLLIVLAIGAFAACNSSSSSSTIDSTAVAPADTAATMAPADTTMAMPADTTHADTTHH